MNHNPSTFQPFNPSTVKPLRNALAALLLLPCAALAQDVPVPEPAAAEPAATNTVPPVLVRDVRVQTIGEERDLEELPPGLIFLDASSGRLMVADDDNPHGRLVCACRDIDWHSFTNDLRVNGHRILLNDAFSLQAEVGAVSLRHGTNSLLQILAADYGSLAPLTAAYEDPAHLLLTANAPADAVLQVCTNLLDPAGWQPAANAVVAAATDAATTWRITLLDGTVCESYRVLATVSRPVGIHANAPLHANSGIVMDGTTWTSFPDTNAFLTAETDAAALAALAAETSARSAADSALDGRVGALENRAEEYWCQWNTDSLAPIPATNYIPTNWPARKVLCFLPNSTTTGYRIALPNWEPDEDCELRLGLWKAVTNNFQSILVDAGGGQVSVVSGNGAQGRECIFRYKFGIGWVFTSHSYTGVPYHIRNGIRRNIPNASLPDDETFAPVTEPAASLLSFSPAPSPSFLSPAALQPEEYPLDEPDFDDPQDPETDR